MQRASDSVADDWAGSIVFPPGTWILAAHPDDETIGAGVTLAASPGCGVLHLTTGAPVSARWRPVGAPASRADYAAVRQAEVRAALALAGIPPARIRALGGEDGDAIRQAGALARLLAIELDALGCTRLVTHPYEGGHPDHDAAALVARLAIHALERDGRRPPALWEMTSYHRFGDALRSGVFLSSQGDERIRWLSAEDLAFKRRMLAAFTSQRETLAQFPVVPERFRPAPRCAFALPPHPGTLWYERMGWMSGAIWRDHARRHLRAFGLSEDAWL
ncbi:MAG: PIG-L family deacetylase [Myxococcaceae bacterium]|nr:PIG-L family deacetylase [Myxococcaceae bacterium]